ncbi:MAG: 50S ribosomal protein L6 [Candidatus Altiarchaeota archaeon]|nr:50S ribosomal protein L6 [Candidatus Altiarchaeota archaeon]
MRTEKIAIPDGVQARMEGKTIFLSSGGKETSRPIKAKHINISVEDGSVVISTASVKKADAAILLTIKSHISNLIKGLTQGITYKMKVVYSHFPVTVKTQNNILHVENFLGEKNPRSMNFPQEVQIEVKGPEVVLRGVNKEVVSQTAAQIEQLCGVRKRDRRVFQDGIYIVEKDGKHLVR